MKKIILSLFFLCSLNLFSQESKSKNIDEKIKAYYENASEFSEADRLWLKSLPVMKLPADYNNKDLPAILDNSKTLYFRGIFAQENFASCQQSSSIGYNFTYEIDRVRNLNALLPENQYSPFFAYNFQHLGNGHLGVSYYNSINILRKCGNPNLADYGGLFFGGAERWMTGYDEYYKAMNNRLGDVFSIPVNSIDGILTLKNYLNDHLDGSEVGGVVSFSAASPWNKKILAEGTPEEGKYVMVEWDIKATHGMVIVGYNDSIRYDYNNDGKYTNDEDINNDGVIDLNDWEIGGFKFANTYGVEWADSGFCYMMYKSLAYDYTHKGIWNESVLAFKVKDEYSPTLTMKVKIKHNSRNKIKVSAGVSQNISSLLPAKQMDFPIFNYQGGNHYMQGGESLEENKTIEAGFDITPILSEINSGEPAKFFLIIEENDPENVGSGKIDSFSVINYFDEVNEVVCTESNIPLIENGKTILSLVITPEFTKPKIVTEELPPVSNKDEYTFQLLAEGGIPPYKWNLKKKYFNEYSSGNFPNISSNELIPENLEDGFIMQEIEFEFPFYGEIYNKIAVHVDGFLMFDEQDYPYAYLWDEELLLKTTKIVGPLVNPELIIQNYSNDGIWYEGDQNSATFRWKASLYQEEENNEINFAVKLYPSGQIEFYYGDFILYQPIDFVAGISEGNKLNFVVAEESVISNTPEHQMIRFYPEHYPLGMEISEDGIFNCNPNIDVLYDNINFVLEDFNNISDTKALPFSTNGINLNIITRTDDDNIIESDEIVFIDIILKNVSEEAIENISFELFSEDNFVTKIDSIETINLIEAGEEVVIQNAFSFKVGQVNINNYFLALNIGIKINEHFWNKPLYLTIQSSLLKLENHIVVDGVNSRLDAGETVDLLIGFKNYGLAEINDLSISLDSENEFIVINEPFLKNVGDLISGESRMVSFSVSVDNFTPRGEKVIFNLNFYNPSGFSKIISFNLLVGKTPVLIIDLDGTNVSPPIFSNLLDSLNINYDISDSLPENLNDYQSVFACQAKVMGPLSENIVNRFSSFLTQGGNLYMEWGRTWASSYPLTDLHEMFNIDIEYFPAFAIFDSIYGQNGSFTEAMNFSFSGYYYFNKMYLLPEPPAQLIFKNISDTTGCGVFYDAGNYKTIGVSFEFGGLDDGEFPATKMELLKRYLNIFNVLYEPIGIQENEETQVYDLTNFPNPFSNETFISFSLKESCDVELYVFDINGRKIKNLFSGKLNAGNHNILWDGKTDKNKTVKPGIYFYSLVLANSAITKKMVRLRF
ncbi:MAG: T9SS type A sorting domain-containing protein [Bacteroidales bacterium]|nr:T9SS type A sorting domain-containing protein [Bacteroidales bacterium]